MTQPNAVRLSGIGSILTGSVVLFFYFRGILPLTDVYVAKKEFIYYLVYLITAVAGAFLLAAALKRKKPGLLIGAGLLLLGLPILFYAIPREPFGYASLRLAMIGRSLIPAAFFFLGIFALKGFKWAHGLLLAAFLVLCLYHLFLAVKSIGGDGGAFSRARTVDVVIALAIAAVTFGFAFSNFKVLKNRR
ncbi:MAG: hypothetical protein NTW38_06920 [Candidatus Aminicenantes bacterium]|nr:hypothetical protein [Candidatus Aminicenantes bacterium]